MGRPALNTELTSTQVAGAADRCLLCTRVAVGSTATAVTGECVYAARAIMGDIPAAETAASADAS
jgi:hypothetical protein